MVPCPGAKLAGTSPQVNASQKCIKRMLMRRRFIQLSSNHAFPSAKQPEQNPACAQQRPSGGLGHCSGKDGRVRACLVSPAEHLTRCNVFRVSDFHPAIVHGSLILKPQPNEAVHSRPVATIKVLPIEDVLPPEEGRATINLRVVPDVSRIERRRIS